MKKNSKLRYVGLCAAALLLVAPVAAPALSAASNVSIVSAATEEATEEENAAAAKKELSTAFGRYESNAKSDTATLEALHAAEDSSFVAAPATYSTIKANGLLALFAKDDNLTFTPKQLDNFYEFKILAGNSVTTSAQALQDLITNGNQLSVVLQAYTADKEGKYTVPADRITLTLGLEASTTASGASGVKSVTSKFTAPLEAKVGDSVSAFETFDGVLSDLSIVSDKGAKLSLKDSITAKPAVDSTDAKVIDGGKFAAVGTATQSYTATLGDLKVTPADGGEKVDLLDSEFNLVNSSVNGVAFRKLGTSYYAVGKDFEVSVSSTTKRPAANDTVTVKRNINVTAAEEVPTEEKVSGVVQINYVPGYGIQVWDSYKDGKIVRDANGKAKKLAHGTAWKVFKKITIKGTTYYNLGGNQWVSDDYAKFSAK